MSSVIRSLLPKALQNFTDVHELNMFYVKSTGNELNVVKLDLRDTILQVSFGDIGTLGRQPCILGLTSSSAGVPHASVPGR